MSDAPRPARAETPAEFAERWFTQDRPLKDAPERLLAAAVRARDAEIAARALDDAAREYESITCCDCADGRDEHETDCPQEPSAWLRSLAAQLRTEAAQ